MSYYLWLYFFEDDVESFRRVLAEASLSSSTHTQRGFYGGVKIGSPGATFSTSPKLTSKNRRASGWSSSAVSGDRGRNDGPTLTRGDINRRDNFGRTILHHAASSTKPSASEFVCALLEIPFLDLYVQDLESGWTVLHRALYFGNISIAHELMARDIRDATDYTTGGIKNHAGGLIKIKDHEGNSPFDVYGTTVAPRRLAHPSQILEIYGDEGDGVSVPDSTSDGDQGDQSYFSNMRDSFKLEGDEVFTFGSNKNLNLGLGDEDDRQYPERISLQRPTHLLQRFRREWISTRSARFGADNLEASDYMTNVGEEISFLALHPPMAVQDVVMSKLHTAIITSDPECNLFVCGFGPGGRLGTGDEATRFNFVCIDSPCLIGKRISSVALGQDHTIAVSDAGEVFTWGSNRFGQLGYSMPKPGSKPENMVQLLPRQLYGSLKKEAILGAAASSIHSVLFTSTSLYTFGKNEGQLGLVDSDARSLELQAAPRKVAASLFASSLVQVSAIDRATICMLESHEVWVFTHFGYAKLMFPLDGFTNYFLQTAMPPTRYDSAVNYISKISSGGNVICAMSSFGEVYTVQVSQAPEPGSATVSTTNPGKIRNSLPQPSRVWSIGKPHMAAKDVDVGQDGSIIICTEAGSVWKKEKRAKIKTDSAAGVVVGRPKDYKFVRIPSLTKAVAVRSNTFGAYAAVRKDIDVTRNQILTDHPLLWEDLFKLLPFRNLRIADEDSDAEYPRLRFWAPTFVGATPSTVKEAILSSPRIEADIKESLERSISYGLSSYDVWLKTNLSETRVPIHEYVLASRSAVIRDALQEFRRNYYVEISEVFFIEYDKDGQIQIQFCGLDFLTLVNLVFYIYTDNVVDARFHTGRSEKQVAKYKQIRSEIMKLAASLEVRNLERSARVMIDPARCLHLDMEQAIEDPSFFECGDILVDLDGSEAKVHSALMSIRCPFFEGLFNGRAGGQWLSERRDMRRDQSELVKVDLKHVNPDTFHLVLKHLYADIGDELFDDVVAPTLDDFLDVVVDVISVANELMLDRLSQIGQKLLGRFVTTRNVSQLLNAVAPCSVTEFKTAALEYICLNLEAMLENRLLDDLDEDLFVELDEVVRSNQCLRLGAARNGEKEAELLARYPDLLTLLEQSRQRRVDSMAIRSRLDQDEGKFTYPGQPKFGSVERSSPSAPTPRMGLRSPRMESLVSVSMSPRLKAKDSANDLMFDMDDEQNKRPFLKTRRLSTTSSNGGGLRDVPENMNVDSCVETESMQSVGVSQGLDQDVSFLISQGRDADSDGGNINASTTPSLKATVPWDSSRFQTTKVNMKELLGQAPANRTSNISLGIAANGGGRSSTSFSSKPSQKERKKLQQQQQHQDPQPLPDARPANTSRTDSGSVPKSPWQTPAKGLSLSLKDAPFTDLKPRPESPEVPNRAPSKTLLTMRQTVSGKLFPPPHAIVPNVGSRNDPLPAPERPASSGSAGTAPRSTAQLPRLPLPSQSPLTPPIQSIRHTPLPKPPSASTLLSMADILAQQQSEKDTIKEVISAKRSLHEIQQEQEFQEWWDQEAAKVKAEQEAADVATARTSGASRGRGKARGRGRGRGSGTGRDPSIVGGDNGKGKGKGEGNGNSSEASTTRGAKGKVKEAAT